MLYRVVEPSSNAYSATEPPIQQSGNFVALRRGATEFSKKSRGKFVGLFAPVDS
jgi:hypothetical protein